MRLVFLISVCIGQILHVAEPTSLDRLEGFDLACWHCNSQHDPKCSEENFNREESSTIMKAPCSKMQREWRIKEPAQTCLKSVHKRKDGLPIVERRCAFVGNPNMANVFEPKCSVERDGGNVAVNCFCKGSYCNKSTTTNLWSSLLLIPIILSCIGLFESIMDKINQT